MPSASSASPPRVAIAIAAHPDDVEFGMAGTLLLLKDAGLEIHLWTLANGNCGTVKHSHAEIVRLRWAEAQAAAKLAGAIIHPPLTDDFGLYYEPRLLKKVAAVVRDVQPNIVLTQSPQDYMEDHQNAGRLAVTAAFVRGMRNFVTNPRRPPWGGDTAVYHAMPHGLCDALRRPIRPELYVDVASVLERKRDMLACHRTQKEWLDVSQGLDAYLVAMEDFAREVGRRSGHFACAEGWRRRLHLGFGPATYDPLSTVLREYAWTDPNYLADAE